MNNWLMTISAGSIVLMLLENIVVGSGLKKTAKFGLGLIFMVVFLQPVIEFLTS